MNVIIKIQHLGTVKDLEINLSEHLGALKSKIEGWFYIPIEQQSLTVSGRNISTALGSLKELGIKEGDIVEVKKIHQYSGRERNGDISAIIKNPMVKGMLKNPDMLKSIQDIFPELKDEMLNNKSLNMILNNGVLEEDIDKMAGDSEYMSQQLRNADLIMAKLNNIPNSMNMMNMMIKEVEDPFKGLVQAPVLKSGWKVNEKMKTSVPGTSKSNLSVEYRKQLSELKEIGFENILENLDVLSKVNGDLQRALEILVSKRGMN